MSLAPTNIRLADWLPRSKREVENLRPFMPLSFPLRDSEGLPAADALDLGALEPSLVARLDLDHVQLPWFFNQYSPR